MKTVNLQTYPFYDKLDEKILLFLSDKLKPIHIKLDRRILECLQAQNTDTVQTTHEHIS